MLLQLVHEAALAYARHADEGDELWCPLVADALERITDDAELALATHELGTGLVGDVDAEAGMRCDGSPYRDRLGLSLCLDGVGTLVVDGRSRRPEGRLVDKDAVDRCSALQARGCVDDIARRHPLARPGLRVEADERLSCGDPHAQLELLIERELPDCERRTNGSLRIVFVGGRRAEERHHRVADELLDGAPVPLELRANPLVVGPQERLHVFGIHRLGLRREPDEVAEDDRDDLSLAPLVPRHGRESTT